MKWNRVDYETKWKWISLRRRKKSPIDSSKLLSDEANPFSEDVVERTSWVYQLSAIKNINALKTILRKKKKRRTIFRAAVFKHMFSCVELLAAWIRNNWSKNLKNPDIKIWKRQCLLSF